MPLELPKARGSFRVAHCRQYLVAKIMKAAAQRKAEAPVRSSDESVAKRDCRAQANPFRMSDKSLLHISNLLSSKIGVCAVLYPEMLVQADEKPAA